MNTAPFRVLIVDDSPTDRLMCRRLLGQASDASVVISEAETGEEGLALCQSESPDCVLLDYVLPDMNGVEFLESLSGAFGEPAPAVVMLTGQGSERVAVEALKRGAKDYLVKGAITAEALSRAVGNATEMIALERRLAEKQQDLERFVSVASHDLMSPLRRISMLTVLARKRGRGVVDQETDELLELVIQDARRMSQLVEALLEFSRVGRSDRRLQPVELGAVVKSALANLEVVIAESKARVEMGPMPTVRGDEITLAQLFQNLIANAIKFRGAAPPVVRIVSHSQDGQCRISVKDNGIGIDSAKLNDIFLPFKRLHEPTEYEGSGIGLATCRRIVDQHYGSIWADSIPGQGATFHLTLQECSLSSPPVAESEVVST